VSVDRGSFALRPEYEIWREADQAMPPPDGTTFDRLKHKIAPSWLKELQRCGDRCFCVGNNPTPQKRWTAAKQRSHGGVSSLNAIIDQGCPSD